MPPSNIEKVLTVFAGIAGRDPNLVTKHVHPASYVEHNPQAAGGVAGLKDYVARLPSDARLEVIRSFEDGPYVFTQADGQILDQNTFFDVFRFEAGLIAEHWSFSAPAGPPNQSGHTQVDGPTQATDLRGTEKNKAFMRRYYETFHLAGDHHRHEQYFKGDLCVRHEPGVRDVAVLMRHRTIDEVRLLLGQGDFVFIAAKGTHEERTKASLARTSTCTGWKTKRSSSTGAFPKQFLPGQNDPTKTTYSKNERRKL